MISNTIYRLLFLGGGEAPKSMSGRILVAAYWLFAVLMLTSFDSNLSAHLTVERMQKTVQVSQTTLEIIDPKGALIFLDFCGQWINFAYFYNFFLESRGIGTAIKDQLHRCSELSLLRIF